MALLLASRPRGLCQFSPSDSVSELIPVVQLLSCPEDLAPKDMSLHQDAGQELCALALQREVLTGS